MKSNYLNTSPAVGLVGWYEAEKKPGPPRWLDLAKLWPARQQHDPLRIGGLAAELVDREVAKNQPVELPVWKPRKPAGMERGPESQSCKASNPERQRQQKMIVSCSSPFNP